MRSIKRAVSLATSSVVAFSSVLMIGLTGVAHAASITWAGTDCPTTCTFSDANNWQGGVAPQAGDTIVFTTVAGGGNTITNDLGINFGGLVVQTDGTSTTTNFTVNTLSFANNAVIDQTQAQNNASGYTNFTASTINAVGALTINGGGRVSATTWNISGVLTLGNNAYFSGNNVPTAGVVVQNGAQLLFTYATSGTMSTPSYPITLGGGTGTAKPSIQFSAFLSGGNPQTTTWAFANPLTLLGDATILLSDAPLTVNQTGSISGAGFAVTLDSTSATGSKLVLSPSSNNSSTVAGTYTGGGAGVSNQSGGSGTASTPATPNTGFALVAAHPGVTLAITVASAGAILGLAFATRKAAGRR